MPLSLSHSGLGGKLVGVFTLEKADMEAACAATHSLMGKPVWGGILDFWEILREGKGTIFKKTALLVRAGFP